MNADLDAYLDQPYQDDEARSEAIRRAEAWDDEQDDGANVCDECGEDFEDCECYEETDEDEDDDSELYPEDIDEDGVC